MADPTTTLPPAISAAIEAFREAVCTATRECTNGARTALSTAHAALETAIRAALEQPAQPEGHAKRARRLADRLTGCMRTHRWDGDALDRAIELLREIAAAPKLAGATVPPSSALIEIAQAVVRGWESGDFDLQVWAGEARDALAASPVAGSTGAAMQTPATTPVQAAAEAALLFRAIGGATGAPTPLTDEQREAEFMRWNFSGDTWAFHKLSPSQQSHDAFIDGFKAGERASRQAAQIELEQAREDRNRARLQGERDARKHRRLVGWYVTGSSRIQDEADAREEARRCGGTARALPLYTDDAQAAQEGA